MDKQNKPTRDDVDLVAAALGLRSSAWAKATVHITEPEFNMAINGEPIIFSGCCGKPCVEVGSVIVTGSHMDDTTTPLYKCSGCGKELLTFRLK
jgi:hypothetical protein